MPHVWKYHIGVTSCLGGHLRFLSAFPDGDLMHDWQLTPGLWAGTRNYGSVLDSEDVLASSFTEGALLAYFCCQQAQSFLHRVAPKLSAARCSLYTHFILGRHHNAVSTVSPPGCFLPGVNGAMMENWICGSLNTWENTQPRSSGSCAQHTLTRTHRGEVVVMATPLSRLQTSFFMYLQKDDFSASGLCLPFPVSFSIG